MRFLAGPRAQGWAATLVLVAAAAAMVATSPETNRISASTSGSLTLGPHTQTKTLRLVITANGTVVQTTDGPIPWRASFDYGLQTSANARPDVRVRFEPLPKGSGPVEDPIVETSLPDHPAVCADAGTCEREFLITFEKVRPRSESVAIDWEASAHVDWGAEDVPEGADLQIEAEDDEPEEAPTPSEQGGVVFGEAFHVETIEPVAFRPLRFEKKAGVAPGGPRLFEIASTVTGSQRARGRLLMIPDDKKDPKPDIGLGGVTHFNPFENCSREEGCVVGYSLELHMAPHQRGLGLDAGVSFHAQTHGIEIHRGGVVLESAPAQISHVLEGSSDLGMALSRHASITNVRRIPRGTPIEVEGLVEARLVGPPIGEPISVETRYGEAVLTAGDRHDAATGLYLKRCTHPCSTTLARDMSLGAVGLHVASVASEETEVEYRLTVRMRFLGLRKVPRGVGLELD